MQRAKSEVAKANMMRLEKDVSDRDSRRKAEAMRDMERAHVARLELVEERLKTLQLDKQRESESERKRLQQLAVTLGLPPGYLEPSWRLQRGGGNADIVAPLLTQGPPQPQRSLTVPAGMQGQGFSHPVPPAVANSRDGEGGREKRLRGKEKRGGEKKEKKKKEKKKKKKKKKHRKT